MEDVFAFGPFVLDAGRGSLTRDGAPVPLGGRRLALLAALVRAGTGVVGKAELMAAAWPSLAVEESNLSVQMAGLRRLLGPQADGSPWIATVARSGYRFAGALAAGAPSAQAPARALVAVLPFEDATGTAAGAAVARTITEDVAAALTSFRWFLVTQRDGPGAHYQLGGSVRRTGRRMRVAARLLDTRTGAQLFARTFEPGTGDAFAAQDELARRIAGGIEPSLLRAESARSAGRSALDLVRLGTGLFHRVTPAAHAQAREHFRAASRLEPDLAEAWIWLARVSTGIVAYGWSEDPAADAAEGMAAGLRGVRLDEANPYAHYGLAIASIYAGVMEQALGAAERSVELSDGFALGHLVLGLARLASGDAAGAVGPLRRGLDLSPGDPQGFAWLNFLARAQVLAGDPTRALETAARLLKVRPDWRPGFETMLVCETALGRTEEARRTASRMAALPVPPGDTLGPLRATYAERML